MRCGNLLSEEDQRVRFEIDRREIHRKRTFCEKNTQEEARTVRMVLDEKYHGQALGEAFEDWFSM
jgi:hypothetical protein